MTENKPIIVQLLLNLSTEEYGGGAERFGINLALSLNPSRFSREVWALGNFGTASETENRARLEKDGIKTYIGADWKINRPYQSWWNSFRSLQNQAKSELPDLINSHSEFADVTAFGLKINGVGGKIVRTVHIPHAKEWPRRPLRRFLFSKIIFPLGYDREVGVSPRLVGMLDKRILSRFLGQPAEYLPNSIDIDRFSKINVDRAGKRRELGIEPDNFLIGSVGRLVPEKGFGDLIAAAQSVIGTNPNIKFLIVGDGPLKPDLMAEVERASITKNMIFTGVRRDLDEIYPVLDLFVSPSHVEGLPTVIMESMASGIPVIATDIPGSQDLITHLENGWLVPKKNPQKLADTILLAISAAEERRSYSEAGRQESGKFSIKPVAEKYGMLYETVLKS